MTISPHSNVRAALVQAAIAWLLAGCAAVPPYQPPRIPEVTGFTAGATPTATTRADGPLGNAQQVVDGTVGAVSRSCAPVDARRRASAVPRALPAATMT